MRLARHRGGRGPVGTRREAARTEPNLLEWTPVRVAEWRDVDGGVVLERPPPKRSGIRGIGRLTSFMAAQRVRLVELSQQYKFLIVADGVKIKGQLHEPQIYGFGIVMERSVM